VFEFVSLFAPIEALKMQNSIKRAVGAAFLKQLGVTGAQVQEGILCIIYCVLMSMCSVFKMFKKVFYRSYFMY